MVIRYILSFPKSSDHEIVFLLPYIFYLKKEMACKFCRTRVLDAFKTSWMQERNHSSSQLTDRRKLSYYSFLGDLGVISLDSKCLLKTEQELSETKLQDSFSELEVLSFVLQNNSSSPRSISIVQLNTLLCLHLRPIKLVVYK